MKPLALLALAAALFLTGCAQPEPMRSTAEAARLPKSSGLDRGHFIARSTWQYRGSLPAGHEFRYYYYRQNDLLYRRVRTAREATVLDFREVPLGQKPHWQWVTLLPDDTGLFHFQLLPPR